MPMSFDFKECGVIHIWIYFEHKIQGLHVVDQCVIKTKKETHLLEVFFLNNRLNVYSSENYYYITEQFNVINISLRNKMGLERGIHLEKTSESTIACCSQTVAAFKSFALLFLYNSYKLSAAGC